MLGVVLAVLAMLVAAAAAYRDRGWICFLEGRGFGSIDIAAIVIVVVVAPSGLPVAVQPLVVTVFVVVAVVVGRDHVLAVLGGGVLDEAVDDPVLKRVHDEREDEHDEGDLHGLVAFGPAQGPVADPGDPRQQREEDEDAELHTEEAQEVDERLLEPPCCARRLTVVSGPDRLDRAGDGRKEEGFVEDSEEDDEDGDTDGGLNMLVNCGERNRVLKVELTSMKILSR